MSYEPKLKTKIIFRHLLKDKFMQHENVEVNILFPFCNDCTSHTSLCQTLPLSPGSGNQSAVSKSQVVPGSLALIILDVDRA